MKNMTLSLMMCTTGILATIIFGCLGIGIAKELPVTIDNAYIQKMIEKAEPLIEEIAGRKYKSRIKFEIAERKMVQDVIAKELYPQLKKIYKDVGEDIIQRQVETSSLAASQSYLGKYSYLSKTFYIIPDNIQLLIEVFEVKDEQFEDFVFLIVAHEMVHALDDQYFDIEKIIMSRDNTDAMQAFNAFLEGHAVYVSEKMAEQLNISEASSKLSTKSAAGMIDSRNRMQQQLFHSVYVKGSEFVAFLIEKQGKTMIDKGFASPPISTRQIMNPEEYLNPSAITRLDCELLLRKVSELLPVEGMRTQMTALGPMNLNAILVSQGVPEKAASQIGNDCITGASFSAAKPALNPKTVSMMVLDFINKESLARYFTVVEKIEDASIAMVKARLNMSLKSIENSDLKIDGYDMVQYRHFERRIDDNVTREFNVRCSIGKTYVSLIFRNPDQEDCKEIVINILKSLHNELIKLQKKTDAQA